MDSNHNILFTLILIMAVRERRSTSDSRDYHFFEKTASIVVFGREAPLSNVARNDDGVGQDFVLLGQVVEVLAELCAERLVRVFALLIAMVAPEL